MYTAQLNKSDAETFLSIFLGQRISDGTKIEIDPEEGGGMRKITLIPKDDAIKRVLMKVMNEGVLHRQGWSKVFDYTSIES